MTISCMTLASHGSGSIGFSTRQFAIGDVNDIDFLQFIDGLGVAANETSKINLSNPSIYGRLNRFASATDLSQITIGGIISFRDDITFDVAFLTVLGNSMISFYPSQVVGGGSVIGASYQCNNSIINKNSVLPGGDVPYADNENCNILPSPPGKVSLSVVLADLATVRTELAQGTGRTQADLAAVRTELVEAIGRIQVDFQAVNEDRRRDRRQQRRADRIRDGILVLATLMLGSTGGGLAYVWWRRRGRSTRA